LRFQPRLEKGRLDGGEQRRQFGVAPCAAGAQRRAVAAMLEPVAVARLAAAFFLKPQECLRFRTHSNHAIFSTPSLPGGCPNFKYAARVLHSGRIRHVKSVGISQAADSPLSRGRRW